MLTTYRCLKEDILLQIDVIKSADRVCPNCGGMMIVVTTGENTNEISRDTPQKYLFEKSSKT
jgi:hypothetical protein